MKNNLIYRIIGASSSSLIIISVFMAFTNITSTSLWDIYTDLDMVYMPIMIIAFGSIGVLFFSLNIKTEFAYATSGAMIFFSVMQLVQAITNNSVSTLGIGFYFVALGGLLTGIMAFLCNIKHKVETIAPVQNSTAVENAYENIMVNPETNVQALTSNKNNNSVSVVNDGYQIPDIISNNRTIPEVISSYSQEKPDIIIDATSDLQNNDISNNNSISNMNIQNQVQESMADVLPQNNLNSSINFQVQDTIVSNNIQKSNLINTQNVDSFNQPVNPVNNVATVNQDQTVEPPVEPNPVVLDLLQSQNVSKPIVNNENNSSNSNMNNLDIFGNFQ